MWRFQKSVRSKHSAPKPLGAHQARRSRVLIWIELILLVSGLSLVMFYGAAHLESWLVSRAALKRFAGTDAQANSGAHRGSDSVVSEPPQRSSEPLQRPNVDFSLWDERRIKAYEHDAPRQTGTALAVLRIPKIGLDAPLFDGTDELTLNHAVGRIAGTARPGEDGNLGIAGHRDGFFRGLKDVKVGDAIELRTPKGTATYIVDQIQIVSPRQVDVLRPTSVPSLTLVTCYPFYFLGSAPQRYIVKASLSIEKTGGPEGSTLSAPATAIH